MELPMSKDDFRSLKRAVSNIVNEAGEYDAAYLDDPMGDYYGYRAANDGPDFSVFRERINRLFKRFGITGAQFGAMLKPYDPAHPFNDDKDLACTLVMRLDISLS